MNEFESLKQKFIEQANEEQALKEQRYWESFLIWRRHNSVSDSKLFALKDIYSFYKDKDRFMQMSDEGLKSYLERRGISLM